MIDSDRNQSPPGLTRPGLGRQQKGQRVSAAREGDGERSCGVRIETRVETARDGGANDVGCV